MSRHHTTPRWEGRGAAVVYVSAICVANLLVFWIGPWWSPVNSLLLIGLDLTLRDRLHERYGFAKTVGLALVAAALSYGLNPAGAAIAVASAVSFAVANIADGAVYQMLLGKRPLLKMNGSNAAGAAADSVLFPTIAFGALLPEIIALQFAAKVGGGFVWSLLLSRKTA